MTTEETNLPQITAVQPIIMDEKNKLEIAKTINKIFEDKFDNFLAAKQKEFNDVVSNLKKEFADKWKDREEEWKRAKTKDSDKLNTIEQELKKCRSEIGQLKDKMKRLEKGNLKTDNKRISAIIYQGDIYYRKVEEIEPGEEMYGICDDDDDASDFEAINEDDDSRINEDGGSRESEVSDTREQAGSVNANLDQNKPGVKIITIEYPPVSAEYVEPDSDLKCPKCGHQFKNPSSFEHHLILHAKNSYDCPNCPKSYLDENELKKHLILHDETRPLVCDECGERFIKVESLSRHKEIHSTVKPYECLEPECGKKFKHKRHLRIHKLVHGGEKPWECTICNKRFIQSSHLRRHCKFTHSTVEPAEQCTVCLKKFRDKGDLKIHLRIHSKDKPFKCSLCDMGFTVSGNLNRHIKKIHLGMRIMDTHTVLTQPNL